MHVTTHLDVSAEQCPRAADAMVKLAKEW